MNFLARPAMGTFTIWVVGKTRVAEPHVGVYQARSVTEAIEQAVEATAGEWKCDPLDLKILGVVEGDIRTLDSKAHES